MKSKAKKKGKIVKNILRFKKSKQKQAYSYNRFFCISVSLG